MAARLTTNTWTRAEWDAAQRGGTEGGFNPDAIQRTSYEEYLKNAGFKSEAEAMAQRAKEDEEGVKFGEVKSADEIKQLSERKGTPEYLAELDAAGAKTREEEARRIALLSKGYITGKEPVYIWGTPENIAWQKGANAEAMATGKQPEVPNAYLDAQAFAARYELYNRYGATTPTVTLWDDAKKQYYTQPNPFFNAKVLEVTPGMGNQWDKLERAKWATVVPGVGSTAATEAAQLAIESFFSRTAGNNPAGQRFFMRTPGDITMAAATPVTPKKTRVSAGPDANGNFVINYSDGSKQVTDKNGVITTTSADGKVIPNSSTVDAFGNAEGWMLGDKTGTKTVSSTTKDANGNTVTKYSDGSTTTIDSAGKLLSSTSISSETQDAFAALQNLFTTYGLGSLSSEISNYMVAGYTPSEALIKLKTNPSGAYAERFAGNFARVKNGLNAMSESAYIELEDSYTNTLKAYGLGNMLSTDSKQNWKQFSEYIANDINAPEFKERIATVEDRVVNADPTTKELFKKWYPSLTDKDLITYFLNPAETIGKLKEKVTSAEIGAAFLGQGLAYTQASATEFAQYGIDRAGALQGAADIKSVLPGSEKLSNIYGEAKINYNQKSAEEEFLKSNQDAAEQRKRLKSMERASFQGDSGITSQSGSLTKNVQGTF
jgi:hypothetical protein